MINYLGSFLIIRVMFLPKMATDYISFHKIRTHLPSLTVAVKINRIAIFVVRNSLIPAFVLL